ncbi:hypothetical protein CPB85DRAFT_1302959 [Mucidula mucida]|nr:hypothetical protein CPB85DRAFT_1302959 [Mucidula mucida]
MDADGTTQFWHWRNVPLLGSFFEDGKESRITSGHVTRDDIPLDTLQSRFIEEDLVWETAEAEVEDDTPPLTPALSMNSIGKLPERPGTPDEDQEWYGLEYTLEMSARDRRVSETQSELSPGECSRSRESWAALKSPLDDEQSFMEWCDWRAYIDHRKAYEFSESSSYSSKAYLNEMWNWDAFYWELHHYGAVSRILRDRLKNSQPDPYYPRRKKNFAWYLKRSRSIASLRELAPILRVD